MTEALLSAIFLTLLFGIGFLGAKLDHIAKVLESLGAAREQGIEPA